MTVTAARADRVLNFLDAFIREHGYAPSVRDVADALDESPAGVHRSLRRLRAEGKVAWEDGKPRTARVVQ